MITLGTGIGTAAMIGGALLYGKHFQASNQGGHLPVVFNGRDCTCGGVGCAEAEAAGWALPQIARDWPRFRESLLAREPAINYEILFRLAAEGRCCGARDSRPVHAGLGGDGGRNDSLV